MYDKILKLAKNYVKTAQAENDVESLKSAAYEAYYEIYPKEFRVRKDSRVSVKNTENGLVATVYFIDPTPNQARNLAAKLRPLIEKRFNKKFIVNVEAVPYSYHP